MEGKRQILTWINPEKNDRNHLCATTIVVLLVQTLASEAWMFLSVWVSSEEVAW